MSAIVAERARVGEEGLNELSQLRTELETSGVAITDLTSTNPTVHGLFDASLLDIVASAGRGSSHYDPTPRGPIISREALAERFGGHPDDYWLTASTSEAYNWLFTLLGDPGDTFAIPTPGYPLIEPLARLASVGVTPYQAHYLSRVGWEYDFGSLAHALDLPTTKALVVVNPNNPTSAYLDTDAADRIAVLCARHGTALIADEVFLPFQLGTATAVTPTRLAGREDCLTFGLDGVSKLLSAPQLKLGWIRLSGPAEARRQAANALDAIADAYLAVSQPVALALPALLAQADASVARVRERINANFTTLTGIFTDDGFSVRVAQGGWMALIDVPTTAHNEDPALVALREAHLYVHPGWFYDLESDSTLALSLLPEPIAFANNAERLKEALQVG
ncbi:MAG: pyridoxal phosphate-dependent aminotransferase [Propionibacteriaceae bacterium]|jgi:aspartate/methionine/tyrosine aminotransferase|nr:pyridoxal phosphate-dependent aminotransferase [Propionibacteriaceae bacterium]